MIRPCVHPNYRVRRQCILRISFQLFRCEDGANTKQHFFGNDFLDHTAFLCSAALFGADPSVCLPSAKSCVQIRPGVCVQDNIQYWIASRIVPVGCRTPMQTSSISPPGSLAQSRLCARCPPLPCPFLPEEARSATSEGCWRTLGKTTTIQREALSGSSCPKLPYAITKFCALRAYKVSPQPLGAFL